MPFQQHKVTGVWREIDAQGRPVGERGTIYTPPADPYKGRQEARQDNEFEYRRANDAADRQAREDALNAEMQAKGFVRGPNGWVKADPKDTIAPEDRSALAQDARTKLETIASLRKRSRDGYFATGFGQPIASMIPGTTARDVQSDVATIGASGALQKVMEMSAANGGKNPLTPLSNADMIMLGQSVSNLDPSQSDDQFIKNLSAYEDIYRRQLQAVEPNAEELRPQAGLLPDGARKVATGKDRWVPDDAYNSTIFKMWRSGASRAEMNAFAAENNYSIDWGDAKTEEYHRKRGTNPFNPAGKMIKNSLGERTSAGPVGGYLSAARSGMALGLDDEMAGGLAALQGQDYTLTRDEFNGRKRAIAENNPISNLVGNVTGGLMLGGGGALVGRTIAPSATSRLLSAAGNNPVKTGAVYGAANGAGENNQDRLGGALEGGGAGAIGGAAGKYVVAPLASKIASSRGGQALAAMMEPFAAKVRNGLGVAKSPGPANVSRQEAMVGSNFGNQPQIRSNIADAADMGLPYSLADADPRLQMLAGAVSRKSPDARALAENALEPRAMGQIDRLLQGIDDDLAPRTNIEQRGQQLIEAGRTEAGPYYNMARSNPTEIDDQLMAMLQTPAGRDALRRAEEIAANEGRNPSAMGFGLDDAGSPGLREAPTFETLDLTKRGFDARLDEARNPITGKLNLEGNRQLGAIEGLRQRFVSRLDEINPDYTKGRAAYSKWAQKRDALNAGKALSAPGQLPRDLENALPRLSNNIDEVQRGYATGMGDTAEKMRYSSNPYDAVLGSPAAQQKLSALFPKGAEKMLRRYDLERQMGKTKYEVMGGSPTAARFQADASLMPAIAEHSGNLMGGMTAGTPTAGTAMRLALTGAKMGMGKSAEKNAAKMAPLLFDQNPAKTLAMFDDLAKRLNANKAYKQKWQKRSGLFGGAAAVPFFTEQ